MHGSKLRSRAVFAFVFVDFQTACVVQGSLKARVLRRQENVGCVLRSDLAGQGHLQQGRLICLKSRHPGLASSSEDL